MKTVFRTLFFVGAILIALIALYSTFKFIFSLGDWVMLDWMKNVLIIAFIFTFAGSIGLDVSFIPTLKTQVKDLSDEDYSRLAAGLPFGSIIDSSIKELEEQRLSKDALELIIPMLEIQNQSNNEILQIRISVARGVRTIDPMDVLITYGNDGSYGVQTKKRLMV